MHSLSAVFICDIPKCTYKLVDWNIAIDALGLQMGSGHVWSVSTGYWCVCSGSGLCKSALLSTVLPSCSISRDVRFWRTSWWIWWCTPWSGPRRRSSSMTAAPVSSCGSTSPANSSSSFCSSSPASLTWCCRSIRRCIDGEGKTLTWVHVPNGAFRSSSSRLQRVVPLRLSDHLHTSTLFLNIKSQHNVKCLPWPVFGMDRRL